MGLIERLESLSLDKTYPDVADWIEKHFYVPEPRDPITGVLLPKGPIQLTEFQKRILREALRRDENGYFVYATILYSAPKKSGKTALASAVVIYLAVEVFEMEFIYLLANDGKGAEDRMLRAIKTCIDLNKKLGGPLAHLTYTKSKIELPNGVTIEALPVDPSGEAGSEPSATFWSELWGATSAFKHKERLWTELTIPPTKWGRAIRWVESYAGFSGESNTLENLWINGVQNGTPHPDFPDLPVFTEPDAKMLSYWDTEPRMPWQNADYYKAEKILLDPSEYRRIHKNEWQRPITAFMEELVWKACNDKEFLLSLIPDDWPTIIGMDLATERDCSALVAVCRHPLLIDHVIIREAGIWYPPVNLTNTVEAALREWFGKYNVVNVSYDPFQAKLLAEQLTTSENIWFNPFAQDTRRAIADKKLQDLIYAKRVHYSTGYTKEGLAITPGISELTKQILNAGRVVAGAGKNKIRLVQSSTRKEAKIDGPVALSMAVDECFRLLL